MHTTRDSNHLSNVRKAQVIGAVTGAIVTVLLGAVVYSSGPRYDLFAWSDGLWLLLTLPTRLICEALGFGWNLPMDEKAIQKIAASLLVNSALLGLLATPFGWLLKPKSDPGS